MVEDENRAVPVRFELEARDAVWLSRVRPVELEQASRLQCDHAAIGLLRAVAFAPAEEEAPADLELQLGDVRQPAAETLGHGLRRPHFLGSCLVAPLEMDAATVAFNSQSSLSHRVPLCSSVSSASRRFVQ